MRIRRSSRLIITSPSSRVLLFHYSHKQGPLSGQDYWGTPGGGVEQGETIEDAGARELFEETGFVTSITDAPIEVRCNQITLPDGEHVLSEDSYFWIKTDSECITDRNWTPEERVVTIGFKWWLPLEIKRCSKDIFPNDLSSILLKIEI